MVQTVELPGAPSTYHFVNAYQEGGKGGKAIITVAKHVDGNRDKVEAVFRDLYSGRYEAPSLRQGAAGGRGRVERVY